MPVQEQPEAFQGNMDPVDAGCGPDHGPYTAPPNTISVDVAVTPGSANDIVVNLKRGGQTIASADLPTGPGPETLHYEPAGGVPEGDYHVQVCDFGDGSPPLPPTSYTGTIAGCRRRARTASGPSALFRFHACCGWSGTW